LFEQQNIEQVDSVDFERRLRGISNGEVKNFYIRNSMFVYIFSARRALCAGYRWQAYRILLGNKPVKSVVDYAMSHPHLALPITHK